MARKTNQNGFDPTGYNLNRGSGVSPLDLDPGPLFSRPASTPQAAENAENTNSLRVSAPLRETSSPLPRSADVAARVSDSRRRLILQFLEDIGPSTIHEFCAAYTLGDMVTHPHQVSGRFTDLAKNSLISPIGERKSPISPAACNVYAITDSGRSELARMKSNHRAT